MQDSSSTNRVLFYRRLVNPDAGGNGGNLKLRDCYNHATHAAKWQANIYFDPATIWYDDPGNHWNDLRVTSLDEWNIRSGDILFFSGSDWQSLSEAERCRPPVPVINIVQPRHVRQVDKRQSFLRYPAIRIAKSEHGASILRQHGVNGPLFVIPDAIDLNLLPSVPIKKDIDVLILGLKQPDLAQELYDKLLLWNEQEGKQLKIRIQLPPKLSTRDDFLHLLSRARVVACVPLEDKRGAEGFYLPALEAMALDTLVVCPHAIGNLGHCLDGINCIVPEFTEAGLLSGVKAMLALPPDKQLEYIEAGREMAVCHRIENERAAVIDLLDRAHDLWKQPDLFLPCAPKPTSIWRRLLTKWF